MRPELEAIIRRELGDDESVVWQTQPRADAYGMWAQPLLAQIGWCFIGLGVLWFILCIAVIPLAARGMVEVNGERRDLSGPEKIYFPAIGVAPIGIGLLARLLPRSLGKGAANAAYALTNRRVLVVAESAEPFEGREIKVQSFGPTDLDRLERTERRDGVGDLVFRPDLTRRSSTGLVSSRPHGLLGIERAAEVERMIRATLRA